MKSGIAKSRILSILIALACLLSAAFAEELIVPVPPAEAQAVIERNELEYEDIRWHSFPGRVRIARIRTDLLHEENSEFTITLFDDLPTLDVKNGGFRKSKWTGSVTQRGISDESLREKLYSGGVRDKLVIDYQIEEFNTVELWPAWVLVDRESRKIVGNFRQYFVYPRGEETRSAIGGLPVFDAEEVIEFYTVYARIKVADPKTTPFRFRTIIVERLNTDPEYTMIYEFGHANDHHHHPDGPFDPVSWANFDEDQKSEWRRKEREGYLAEKEAYFVEVAKRIAQRKNE